MSEYEKKKRKIVFLLLVFSLVISFLPVQIYLPSIAVDAASQFQKYFNYSINQNVFLTQYLQYFYTYSISVNITMFKNLHADYVYCSSIGIIIGSATSSSIPCAPGGGGRGGGGGGGGGGNIIIPGSAMLSFATTLALVGIPVLLLAAVAGPAGLFIGILIGGGMAFMANLLPTWLIIMLALAAIMLIALMMRRKE